LEDFKSIISDCIAGNRKAQANLYRQFAPKMFGVCLRYAKDATEAEDNLQDGFIKVFTNLKSFRHDGSFEGWIRRIMINVSLEKLRKQYLLYPVEDVSIYDSVNFSDDIIAKISFKFISRNFSSLNFTLFSFTVSADFFNFLLFEVIPVE